MGLFSRPPERLPHDERNPREQAWYQGEGIPEGYEYIGDYTIADKDTGQCYDRNGNPVDLHGDPV
ncbi:MAG: hypothetical protein ACRDTC_23530 [Pseudonocardiaceae bacterium]